VGNGDGLRIYTFTRRCRFEFTAVFKCEKMKGVPTYHKE